MKHKNSMHLAENRDRILHEDHIIFNNPVFVQGLGLAPIVVAAYNLNNALILALGVTLLLTPTRIIAARLLRKSAFRFRAVTYTLTAAILYILVWFVENAAFGVSVQYVGIYLPLLVVEPLIIKRSERAQTERPLMALRKGLLITAGFLLALFLVAFLRELLGSGTLFGVAVTGFKALPMMQMTCGGFILAGLLSALWQWFRNLLKRHVNMEANAK